MRWLLGLALTLMAGIAAATGFDLLGRIERAMMYPFDATRVSPAQAGLSGVTETVWSRNEADLILWHAAPAPGKPLIIYFHGNAGNLANRAPRFELFLREGFGLLALSPRSAGGSTGTPSQQALTDDAAALIAQATTWVPGSDLGQIVLYGESLGTGIAIAALARSGLRPAAVILEAPFTSVVDVARDSGQIPDSLLPRIRDRWLSEEHAGVLTMPLLVIHGTEDEVIPHAQGRALFEAAPSPAKRFLPVPGGGHSDLWRSDVIGQIMRFARSSAR